MNLHAETRKIPTILDAHVLPPAWRRRYYELIGERNRALHAGAVGVSIGHETMRKQADADVSRIDDALARILDAHAKGLLRKWGAATLEGLLP